MLRRSDLEYGLSAEVNFLNADRSSEIDNFAW